MVYPPVTVLQKGLDSIRLWCKCRAADRLNTRRHTIVLALHNVLSQIQEVCVWCCAFTFVFDFVSVVFIKLLIKNDNIRTYSNLTKLNIL